MISDRAKSRRPASARVAALLVVVSCLLIAAEGKGAPQTRPAKKKAGSSSGAGAKPIAHRTSATPAAKRSSHSGTRHTTHSTKGKKRYSRGGSRQRLAALHLDAQRVGEIQQALIREGVLTGPASGAWDDSTRDAMRRYQASQGFAETGLPDAKSLMKLGLGPHPLPEDIQPTAAAQSRAETLTKPNN